MNTIRVVLCEPFVRHPAGSVFELSDIIHSSGWEEDDRLREKMNFLDKAAYHLPDGGNGRPYELLRNATAECPEEIFDNIDLRSGPCRITHAAFQREGAPNDMYNPGFGLFDIDGLAAQGLIFPLENIAAITLYDRLRDELLYSPEAENRINCSALMPGFYELCCVLREDDPYHIRFIKSFPLLVMFRDRWHYDVQKTLY